MIYIKVFLFLTDRHNNFSTMADFENSAPSQPSAVHSFFKKIGDVCIGFLCLLFSQI